MSELIHTPTHDLGAMANVSHKRSDIAGKTKVKRYVDWNLALFYIQALQIVGGYSETMLSQALNQPNGWIAHVKRSKYVLNEDALVTLHHLATTHGIPTVTPADFTDNRIPTKRPDVEKYLVSNGIDPNREKRLVIQHWKALVDFWIGRKKTWGWLDAQAGYKNGSLKAGLVSKTPPKREHVRKLAVYTRQTIGEDAFANIFNDLEPLPDQVWAEFFEDAQEKKAPVEPEIVSVPVDRGTTEEMLVMPLETPLTQLAECAIALEVIITRIKGAAKHLPHGAARGLKDEVIDYLDMALTGLQIPSVES